MLALIACSFMLTASGVVVIYLADAGSSADNVAVLAICLGLLLALAAPAIHDWMKRYRLRRLIRAGLRSNRQPRTAGFKTEARR